MNEEQVAKTLESLAHYVVRNEIVCEHFLKSLGVSQEAITGKVNETDEHLKSEKGWQRRFPELFPD